MWVPTEKLPRSPGHPFYERLNRVRDAGLEESHALTASWKACARFYAERLGRQPGHMKLCYGHGKETVWRTAAEDVGADGETAAQPGTSVLRAVEPSAGESRL